MQKKYSVGVDIGGSHITCAAIDLDQGKIIRHTLTEKPVNNKGSATEIIDSWAEALSLTVGKTEHDSLRGIGFALYSFGMVLAGFALPGALLAAVFASRLGAVKIDESGETEIKASFKSAFNLLGNKFVLLMVLAIFVVVGMDVGYNSNSGQFLINSFGLEQTAAESGRSVYFLGRMLGTFLGALLLSRIASRRFYLWTTIMGIFNSRGRISGEEE